MQAATRSIRVRAATPSRSHDLKVDAFLAAGTTATAAEVGGGGVGGAKDGRRDLESKLPLLSGSASGKTVATMGSKDDLEDIEDRPLLHRKRETLAAQLSRLLSPRSGPARVAMAAAVSVSWMFFSSVLILVNKHILKDLKFPYPMTVSSMGMFASGVFSWLVVRVLKLAESEVQISTRFYLTNVLPVGFFMALTLWSGNTVYLYLTVSFVQMLKAFTPVITMIALFIARLETPNRPMILSVLVIAAGTALSAYGEVNLHVLGTCIMFVSEMAEATRLVMTQYLLVGLKMGPFEGLMYLSPACFLWLSLGGALLEWRSILDSGGLSIAREHWPLFVSAACMGFVINLLAFATIKLASSLTLKVLGTVKNALLILAAMALYAEVVTALQAWGYVLSTIAFGVYTWTKMKQIAAHGG